MRFARLGYSALGFALLAGNAHAGGFSRGTADTDILFEPGEINLRAGAMFVMPRQEFSRDPLGQQTGSVAGTDYLDTYVIPSAAIKFKIVENLSCAGTYTDPHGAASSYADPYGPVGKLAEELTVSEFGGTCALFFDMGPGRLAFLGGAFVETIDYDLSADINGSVLDVGLEGTDYGWRAGLAYEITDIALRAQLLYRSGTSYGATGFLNGVLPAAGTGELPQSVELKVQSGIAPGWLAFGSVKWMDWSVNETLTITTPVAQVSNQYFWRDGWTVTAGIGREFNEKVSGLVSLQWDRGVSTGYDLRTDKWLLAGGASIKDELGGELRLGAGITYLTSADITAGTNVGAAADSGWAGILSAAYTVTW